MKIKATLLALAFTATGATQAAPVISNGNFETGLIAPWTTNGNVTLTSGGFGGFYFGAGSLAQDGNFAIAFNAGDSGPNGSVSQTFTTVAGQGYDVMFDYGATSNGSQSLLAWIMGADGATTLASMTATDSNPDAALTTFSFHFIADGSSATLNFTDSAANSTVSLDGVLDNVAVNGTVPEPASLALLGLGLLGLGATRRKRSA